MKLEDLIKAGLTEEQAKKVLEMHKAAIDGNYVPKATFEAEREKVKTANETIADRDKQIKELGAFKGDNEELKKKVEQLETANAEAAKKYQEELEKKDTDMAIRTFVADKVHSADDIIPRIDVSKLTIKDGKVVGGLTEQLDEIKKTCPHYFKEENTRKSPIEGWNMFNRTPEQSSSFDSAQTDVEFGKMLAKDSKQSASLQQRASEVYFK
jgi:hypothetical protein